MDTREIEVFCNEPFYWTLNCDKRIIVHQGGTGSGKTYSILQALIYLADTQKNLIIDIGRRKLTSLKASAYMDFLTILSQLPIEVNENRSELIYEFKTGSKIQFFGMDEPQKMRSRRRDILYLNEVNEISLEMWRQLSMRTRQKIICDFNPSDPIHWVYDKVMPREDCETFISTYKNNKFLSRGELEEILSYKDIDENYWNVFGLGQRGVFLKGQIFKDWAKIDRLPEDYDSEFFCIDFGFSNDPTAIVQIRRRNGNIYAKEIVYEKHLTNQQIAEKVRHLEGPYYCDSAEPKSIKELRNEGINAIPSIKGPDSIKAGIQHLKKYNVFVTEDSPNIWNEYYYYQWELDKNDEPTNKPKDFMNHAMDAIRYGVFTRYFKSKSEWVI